MKIDRLIGILSILLQKETVTAPYLANQFEVSRRTINRDIENLCKAGIPVVTKQGVNGGISIMDDYKLEHTLLTNSEMQDILAGLRSLDSINGTNRYGQLMEKLAAGTSDFMTGNQSILIDLSSWYKESLAPKIELIRNAIDNCREIEFKYYSPHGDSERCIKPYYLIFRWSSWYVWGWCKAREDFRLFKLNRLENLRLSETVFVKQPVALPDLRNERIFPGGIHVKAVFDAACKWRLIEEFGPNCFEEQADKSLLFQADYTNKENLITWILTFREQAIVLEPKEIRDEIQQIIEKMQVRNKTMATEKGYLEYILDQLSGLTDITYRMMMGEYIIYYRGKIAAYVCDNRFLVKPVDSVKRMIPDAPLEPPYEGAKDMILVEDIDNREFLTELFEAMYEELPEPKRKKRR